MRNSNLIFLGVLLVILLLPGMINATTVESFLMELGEKYYKQGRYEDALHEFQKVLILNSRNQEAMKNIEKLAKEMGIEISIGDVSSKEKSAETEALIKLEELVAQIPEEEKRRITIQRALEELEQERQKIKERKKAELSESE